MAEDALVVVDARGQELWTKSFGFALVDYQGLAERHLTMGWVGDVDGDGEREVLFLVHPRQQGTPMVYCYSGTGVERWRFAPGKSAEHFATDYQPPYNPENLLVFRVGGAVRIAVASVHHTWFPSQIALLSADGKLLREYWHAGHIQFLAASDSATTKKTLLYAGGIANAYHRAVLVALDPESFGGSSQEGDAAYQLPGPPGREVVRVLFPRSCVNLTNQPFNGVMSLQMTPTELVVGVAEEVGHPAVVVHTFAPDGRHLGTGFSSGFAARHAELERTKVLDHHLDAERETASSSRLEWVTRSPTFTVGAVPTKPR